MLGSSLLPIWFHRSTYKMVFALPAWHFGQTILSRAVSHFPAVFLPFVFMFSTVCTSCMVTGKLHDQC